MAKKVLVVDDEKLIVRNPVQSGTGRDGRGLCIRWRRSAEYGESK